MTEHWHIIVSVLIALATCIFIVYDSRKKSKKTNQVWHDAGLHHRAHPGCLGHPEDCIHMTSNDEWRNLK